MRKYILAVIVMLIAGIGFSLYLIPDEAEVETFRTQDASRTGMVDFAKRYEQGDRSASILVGMTQRMLAEERGSEMQSELNAHLEANPEATEVRVALARVYRQQNQLDRYLTHMQQAVEQAPTTENLELLADAYNLNENYSKQADILRRLIDQTEGEKPDYFSDLAILLALQDQHEAARAVIAELKATHPNYTSFKLTRAVASGYVDSGQMQEAFRTASRWLADHPNPQQIAILADLLNYGGRAELALQLIEPHRQLVPGHATLLLSFVNASINAEKTDYAYSLLKELHTRKQLPALLYRPFLELTFYHDDWPLARQIIAELDPALFSETEAVNLLALASDEANEPVLVALLELFSPEEYRRDKPVLSGIIALARREEDEDATLQRALASVPQGVLRLRLAEACVRNHKTECFEQMVADLPPLHALTDKQLNDIALLFISADQPDRIRAEMSSIAEKRNTKPAFLAAMRLAAASGEYHAVSAWLKRQGRTASSQHLSELFFLASDRDHSKTAAEIAALLYDREPSKQHREYLASAYLRSGQSGKALPLLREMRGQSTAKENDYLAALVALSRSDAAYRDELADYVLPQLESGAVSAERKRQLVYTLINTGQTEKAKPSINRYAKSIGGEWRTLYNQIYAKASGGGKTPVTERSRDFRVALARDPKTDEDTKRRLAFSLLDDGYRDEAVDIFFDMAQTAAPGSQEMDDLLYLWGPRLNSDQLGWLELRASNATAPGDRVRWGEMIARYGDDFALMNYITEYPEALAHPSLRERYFTAMATHADEQTFVAGMQNWIDATDDISALRDYARTAIANGYPNGALNALNKMQQLDPQDEWTLKQLAVLHYGQADYSTSGQYIDAYLQRYAQKPQPETSPYEVVFYQASLLRRNNQIAAALPLYQQIAAMGPQQADDVNKQSIYYTSLFYIGHEERAREGFYMLLNHYPDDKGLLADFINVLLETGYLEEAKLVANQYDQRSPLYQQLASPYEVQAPNIQSVQPLENGQEMQIQFDGPAPQMLMPDSEQGAVSGWIEGIARGHDSVVVAAKPGYRLRFTPTSAHSVAIVASNAASMSPKERLERQQHMRLQLLYARMELASGKHAQARARIEAIKPHFEDDPQFLGYAANVENATGNWPRALALLERAQQITPYNEDLAQLRENIEDAHPQEIKIDHTWRRIGDSDEQISTLAGRVRPTRDTELGIVLQNNEVNAAQIRQASTGDIGDFNVSRQRAEIYGSKYFGDGDEVKAALYADNDSVGGGAYYEFNNPAGRTEVLAEYQRPYWNFPEAVFEKANRSRVGVKHFAALDERTTISGELSYNQYNIEEDADTTRSTIVRANLVRRIRDAGPTVALAYGFDGEYLSGEEERIDANGNPYETFALISREIHYPSVIVSDKLTSHTRGELVAGWAFDRLGEHGPQVQGTLTQDITDDVEAQLRASYGLQTNDTDQNATHVGGHLRYKF